MDECKPLAKGPTEDLERWQAAVARSVEARLYAEFDTFLTELEPSLRDSGRQVTRGLLGGAATLVHLSPQPDLSTCYGIRRVHDFPPVYLTGGHGEV